MTAVDNIDDDDDEGWQTGGRGALGHGRGVVGLAAERSTTRGRFRFRLRCRTSELPAMTMAAAMPSEVAEMWLDWAACWRRGSGRYLRQRELALTMHLIGSYGRGFARVPVATLVATVRQRAPELVQQQQMHHDGGGGGGRGGAGGEVGEEEEEDDEEGARGGAGAPDGELASDTGSGGDSGSSGSAGRQGPQRGRQRATRGRADEGDGGGDAVALEAGGLEEAEQSAEASAAVSAAAAGQVADQVADRGCGIASNAGSGSIVPFAAGDAGSDDKRSDGGGGDGRDGNGAAALTADVAVAVGSDDAAAPAAAASAEELQLASMRRTAETLARELEEHASYKSSLEGRWTNKKDLDRAKMNWARKSQHLVAEYDRYSMYAQILRTAINMHQDDLAFAAANSADTEPPTSPTPAPLPSVLTAGGCSSCGVDCSGSAVARMPMPMLPPQPLPSHHPHQPHQSYPPHTG
ncbi:hypothetical protein HK405_004143 [Cladochytrium tenue]|nr:hypothetical protein HK405_004143 [Cladochytrium tenue]